MPELWEIQSLFDIDFSDVGNSEEFTRQGWSEPEAEFTWAVDEWSKVVFSHVPPEENLLLEVDVEPLLSPPLLPAQRISVTANDRWLGETSIGGSATRSGPFASPTRDRYRRPACCPVTTKHFFGR